MPAFTTGLPGFSATVCKMKFASRFFLGAIAGLRIAIHPCNATAQVDFTGKRITIIVPASEGGTSDTYARIVGPALTAELPGSPTLVIQNIPGTGTMAGANQFEQRAAPDGLTLLSITTATYLNHVFTHKAAK